MKNMIWYQSIHFFSLIVFSKVLADDPKNVKTRPTIPVNLQDYIDLVEPTVEDKVQIFMYTPDHKNETEVKLGDKDSLSAGNFDPKYKVFVCSHGFLNNHTTHVCADIKDALLEKGDVIVFVIDWGRIAQTEKYPAVASSVGSIGKFVAAFIDFIVDQGVQSNLITIVGHSLGCHIVGNIGRNTKQKVGRIVGLDCALPAFIEGPLADLTINKTDAEVVETWISNAQTYGMEYAVGDITCYLNNGSDQPGCTEKFSDKPLFAAACSHIRVATVYAESISKGGVSAKMCSDKAQVETQSCDGQEGLMGGIEQKSDPGIYNLITNSEAPFLK